VTTCSSLVATAGLLYCVDVSITGVFLDGSPLVLTSLPVIQTEPSDAGAMVVVSQMTTVPPGPHTLSVTSRGSSVEQSLTVVAAAPDRSDAHSTCLHIDGNAYIWVSWTTLTANTRAAAILIWGADAYFRGAVPHESYFLPTEFPMVIRGVWSDGTLSAPFLYPDCTKVPGRLTDPGHRFEPKATELRP